MTTFLHQTTTIDLLLAPVAATSADQTGESIDMQGFDGCEFTAVIGTAANAALATLQIQTGSSTTAFVDLTSASAASTADADDGLLVVDVLNRGGKRYLRPTLANATTGNIEYGGIIARRYRARDYATTATTTGDLLAAKVYLTNPTTAA